MKDEEIKNLLKVKSIKEPDFEWSKIKSSIKANDIKVKLSTFGVFATLLLLITLNIYQQEESTDVNEVINYMFEDNYLAADSTYDYVDLY